MGLLTLWMLLSMLKYNARSRYGWQSQINDKIETLLFYLLHVSNKETFTFLSAAIDFLSAVLYVSNNRIQI